VKYGVLNEQCEFRALDMLNVSYDLSLELTEFGQRQDKEAMFCPFIHVIVNISTLSLDNNGSKSQQTLCLIVS